MESENLVSSSWLEKPVFKSLPAFRIETFLIALLVILALVSRLTGLGERVMSHDEVNHVVPSWNFSEGRVYVHDPVTHGPLQFHLIALSYFLFGDNDFTSRLPHALFNVTTIIFVVFMFRRYISKAGALIAGFLMLISPYMLFYARYARNDIIVVFFIALMFYAVWRYLEKGNKKTLFLLTAALIFQFTLKEVAYIHTAQLLLFLAVLFFIDLAKARWSDGSSRSRFILAVGLMAIFVLATTAGALWLQAEKKATPTEITAPALIDESLPTDVKNQQSVADKGVSLPQIVMIAAACAALLSFLFAVFTVVTSLGWDVIRSYRSFDMLMLCGSLVLPLLAAIPVHMIGWDPLDYSSTGMIHTGIVVIVLVALSLAIGFWWNWRKWLWHAALFWGVFIIFFTSFFTNGQGFFTGLVGALGYWMAQQEVARGSQPFYYYALIQIPVYEYLPAVGTLVATIIAFVKGLITTPAQSNASEQQSLAAGAQDEPIQPSRLPVIGLLVYWAASALLAYSYAGEKMPQMTLYVAFPMILLTAWMLGFLIDRVNWKSFWQGKGLLILALIPVFFAAITGMFSSLLGVTPPFQGNTLEQLKSTNQFLLSFLATAGVLALIIWLVKDWASQQIWILAALFVFLFGAVFTIRTAYTASYINYDTAKEYLVYAHAARGPKDILEQVKEISTRTTGGLDVKVAYDSDGLYPYWWYFRDYPNHHWFGENPSRDLRDYPLIIVSEKLFGKIEPVVQNNYIMFQYIRLWWPNQDYYNLTWERIKNAFLNPDMRAAVFDIWFNRDYTKYAALTNNQSLRLETWEPADSIRLYVRKDIIADMWNYGSMPVLSEEVSIDPYEANIVELLPTNVFGRNGVGVGELSLPRQVAVAPDGSIYVADQANHRVQHFAASGELLHVWGSYGSVVNDSALPGTFNEPWGIAVGSDGSVYVADTWNYRIQKFSPEGDFITMWGYSGQGESPEAFYGPRGLAVDTDGNVYVADTGNKRIVVFDSNGAYLTQFGGAGMELGKLEEPVAVALDANGNVYVTDTWNQRIQVFTPTSGGAFFPMITWDINGWFSQSIENKPFIAVDPINEYVFVTDPEGYRVLQFDLYGSFIRTWGDYSPDISGFGLPVGIAVDSQGKVWVSDSENGRVLGFDLSGLPEPLPVVPQEEMQKMEDENLSDLLQDEGNPPVEEPRSD